MRTALLAVLLCVPLAMPLASFGAEGGARQLLDKHAELKDRLAANAFGKPIALDSRESSKDVAGDIYAVIGHSFAKAGAALEMPGNWCDVLLLHLNTKQCRAVEGKEGAGLQVHLGKKHDQSVEQADAIAFDYRVASKTGDYLQVRLDAAKGPLGTHDYRIVFEAAPLPDGQTFVHLAYSYGFGMSGRLAMQAYLGTIGSDKVGFTTVGNGADGKPRHVGGLRGVIERNTVRYLLAVEAFLGSAGSSPEQRFEKAAQDWFVATERYARQLHEMDGAQYLAMKRKEYARQTQGSVADGRRSG